MASIKEPLTPNQFLSPIKTLKELRFNNFQQLLDSNNRGSENPPNRQLLSFPHRLAQHFTTVGETLFINSADNNISVYKCALTSLQSPTTLLKTVNIAGRGMACSLSRSEASLLVGCKDGTLVEIDVKQLQIRRELTTENTIATITEISSDVVVIG